MGVPPSVTTRTSTLPTHQHYSKGVSGVPPPIEGCQPGPLLERHRQVGHTGKVQNNRLLLAFLCHTSIQFCVCTRPTNARWQKEQERIRATIWGVVGGAYLGLLVRGHPEEGHEDGPVNVTLRLCHGRGARQPSRVQATGGVAQVRVQTLLQRLVEHDLAGNTAGGGGRRLSNKRKTHLGYITAAPPHRGWVTGGVFLAI